MKLHNSLTNKLEELKPIRKGQVSLYTCGPTVYDHVHIGNLRTYIFEDTLRRTLRLSGYKVQHVMNITDIDDKTIKRSQEDYPEDSPEAALGKLTRKYQKIFLEDAQKLGIDLADSTLALATEHIDEMQALIVKIPNKYIAEDGVYFDITKDSNYGVLVKLDQSHQHHRIANDDYDKEHVADFALWKAKKEGEPSWDFEIDGQNIAGHPGWHIECSAMSAKYLGQPFDIHTGGVDLKFPHHENEIAQSRSAQRKSLANYFVHAEHLLVDGKKMSKRLKNFYTLEDVIKKGFHPLAFRLLVLQSHYRSQLNFTWESLAAAQEFLQKLYAWADLGWQGWVDKPYDGFDNRWETAFDDINQALSDDINTAEALAVISKLSDWLIEHGITKHDSPHSAKALERIDEVFALGLNQRLDIGAQQKSLITKREQARQNGDFKTSDGIRDELKAQGIGLNDNSYGVTWYRFI